jgi:hypothetical protein
MRRTDLETPVARREALISLARATFAVGGSIAVPLDVDVAPLLGTLALDYLQPRAAEVRGEPPIPRVIVMETQLRSEPARRLFAPLAARGGIRFVDQRGEDVVLEASDEAEIWGLSDVARHMVTHSMVQVVRPTFAVLINPDRRVIDEVSILREANVPTFNFGEDEETGASFIELGVVDPTGRLLAGTTRSPWAEEDLPRGARHPVPPYAYLMQRLIAEHIDL